MKVTEFGPCSPGRLVKVPYPEKGVTHAFVPDLLPSAWEWEPDLWPLLLEAHKALSSLDGTGKHLPNPELVLRPLQRREAQKSSSLEGTYTNPEQQALFEVDPSLADSQDDISAYREVSNYAQALRYRRESSDLPLSLRLIRNLHSVLMDGVRGHEKRPGYFRKQQNHIGRPARFVPPPPIELVGLLDNLEKYLHTESGYDPLVKAFITHYQFEAIHPFMDGNGRVGRLLLSLTIEEWCQLSNQWLYMSPYFDRNKDAYIDRLYKVSTAGDWSAWIEFCLNGVVEQARDTIDRCEQLINLNREFHEKVGSIAGSIRLAGLVDALFINPVITVTRAADQFEVSYPTAKSDLVKLEKLGILRELPTAKQRTYYCFKILRVTHAD